MYLGLLVGPPSSRRRFIKSQVKLTVFFTGPAGPCTKKIPLFNILWAEVSDQFKVCTVTFVEETSKTTVKPVNLDYPLDKADIAASEQWVRLLLEKAYGGIFEDFEWLWVISLMLDRCATSQNTQGTN